MATSPQENSPVRSSPPSVNLAQENAWRLLEAQDKGAEAGLQAELNRVYPDHGGRIGNWDPVDGSEVGLNGLRTINLADLTPEQRQAVETGDFSTLKANSSPK
jgi:hypothetical protein